MRLTLRIWRQPDTASKGSLHTYRLDDVSPDMSFLEMLDVLNEQLNQNLEKAGRVADFFELGELMCIDALHRAESAGGHFRAESQTPDGEALRHDEQFSYVAAWQFAGTDEPPVLRKEALEFQYVHPSQRSYK